LFVIFDIEYSGHGKDRLEILEISLSLVVLQEHQWTVTERYNTSIKPVHSIDYVVRRLLKKTNKDYMYSPNLATVAKHIVPWFSKGIFVSHGCKSDLQVLAHCLAAYLPTNYTVPYICSYHWFDAWYPFFKKKSLLSCVQQLKLDTSDAWHNAERDCYITGLLAEHLYGLDPHWQKQLQYFKV
jgi:DNA polymerase III alpha subunit (gram-positive type)